MKTGILKLNQIKKKCYIDCLFEERIIELNKGNELKYSPDLNKYIKARLEFDDEWYLITLDGKKISIFENMLVKK